MERQHLHERLEELHVALRDAEAVDPESRELLRQLLDDIRGVLEREPGEPQEESLTAKLRDAVDAFEGEHPTLTAAAGRVIDALAKMGI